MPFSLLCVRPFAVSRALPRAFGYPAFGGTDFCLITRQVALKGAIRILLVLLPMIRSYPAIATGYAGTLVPRVVRTGIFHKADLIACETDLPG